MSRPDTLRQARPGLKRFARHFRPLLRDQRALIGGSFAALFAEVVLRVFEPWPLKFVIDGVLMNGSRVPSAPPAANTMDPMVLLTLASVALIAITSLRALAAYGSTIGFALVGNRVLNEVRNDLYRHLQILSLRFHSRSRGGDLLMRVMGDVGLLRDVAVTAVLPLLGNVFVLVSMVSVMLWLDWRLTLVVVATAPLLIVVANGKSRRIQDVARGQRRRESALATTAAESIATIKVVQALSLEEKFGEAFSRRSQRSVKEGVKGKRLAAGLERSVDVIIAIGTALVLWYGALSVLGGRLTAGEFLVFLAYLKASFKPVRNWAKFTGRIAKASAAGERVLDVLETEPEVRNLAGARSVGRVEGAIEFDRVTFAYEGDRPVLDAVTFKARPGDRIALVGSSGAGKSTIVSLMLRLYDPTSGRVLIDGMDARTLTLESLRSLFGVVLQDTALFAGSVADNIACGAPDAGPGAIEAAAKLARADGFIRALPQGYETEVGERGVMLSSGQRQRIAIARAAVRNAPFLILDEPTTGLDEANERAVVEALERLAQGRTTFLITHDLEQASTADRILYLRGGGIAEQGTHEHLMSLRGNYAAAYLCRESPEPRRREEASLAV